MTWKVAGKNLYPKPCGEALWSAVREAGNLGVWCVAIPVVSVLAPNVSVGLIAVFDPFLNLSASGQPADIEECPEPGNQNLLG